MNTLMMMLLVVIGFVILLVVVIYNRLVVLRTRTAEAWSAIDVQLKQRADMIPNLVETVKGYAAHEKTTLENVAKARAMVQEVPAGDVAKAAEANNVLTSTLRSLFAVTENYPELKANTNFTMLQQEISGLESKIAYARQFYNENVMAYNQYQQVFPSSMFASMFGHSPKGFYEADEADRKRPEVKF